MTARIGRFFVGIPLACLLMAQVVEAADLKAISFAGDYRIRIVGNISPVDKDRLTAMFERRGGFPESIYLESDGGDIDASMDIGRVIRRNMIPVDSLRACSGACFLAWVGGVDRIAQGNMDIRLATENSSQARSVRAYLEEMEVPEEVITGWRTEFGTVARHKGCWRIRSSCSSCTRPLRGLAHARRRPARATGKGGQT